MSSVSEMIVREYFETLGFLVQQPRKYQVAARPKRPDEEIDLIGYNPNPQPIEGGRPGMVWTARELQAAGRVLVGIRGWHADRFSPSLLAISPEICRFADDAVVRQAERMLGEGPVVKVLCLPNLPASSALRDESLRILNENGIDAVVTFPTILLELSANLDESKGYEKSDVLQMLRILKCYDLLKDAQMELFPGRRHASAKPRRKAREQAPPPA